MTDIFKLIERLDKVKSRRNNKWLACCPAHEDRSPSLAIKHVGDKILLHCSVEEVIQPLGLTLADLFPDNREYRKVGKPPKFNKYEMFDRVVFESTILLLAIRQLWAGTPLTDSDIKRVLRAESTIDDITSEVRL